MGVSVYGCEHACEHGVSLSVSECVMECLAHVWQVSRASRARQGDKESGRNPEAGAGAGGRRKRPGHRLSQGGLWGQGAVPGGVRAHLSSVGQSHGLQ